MHVMKNRVASVSSMLILKAWLNLCRVGNGMKGKRIRGEGVAEVGGCFLKT